MGSPTLQPPQNPLLAMSNFSATTLSAISSNNVVLNKDGLVEQQRSTPDTSSPNVNMHQPAQVDSPISSTEKNIVKSPNFLSPKVSESSNTSTNNVKVKTGKRLKFHFTSRFPINLYLK